MVRLAHRLRRRARGRAEARKSALRDDYKKKLAQAVNLDALASRREQVQQYVTQLEKQLPSKAEMDALLSDINQAGLGRSLQLRAVPPRAGERQGLLRGAADLDAVTGRYHDIGAFASDIANLSRIVTLNNLRSSRRRARTARWRMDATAKTFRYLDHGRSRRAAQGARRRRQKK